MCCQLAQSPKRGRGKRRETAGGPRRAKPWQAAVLAALHPRTLRLGWSLTREIGDGHPYATGHVAQSLREHAALKEAKK